MKNPQAFPRSGCFGVDDDGRAEEKPAVEGMTLLDYFAAKFMQGFASSPVETQKAAETAEVKTPLFIAKISYSTAAVMLQEREKYINE